MIEFKFFTILDNFNVPFPNDTHYTRYSVQGVKHKRSYKYLHRDSSGDLYSFIGVDATLEPGIIHFQF